MPWQELGGADAGLGGNAIQPNIHWLGTRNAAPLIIRTENGALGPNNAPNPAAEAMRITAAADGRRVGIGTTAPRAKLEVSGNLYISASTSSSEGGQIALFGTGNTPVSIDNVAGDFRVLTGGQERIRVTNQGVLQVRPVNDTTEGGEITLLGAGTNTPAIIDNVVSDF
jgi:hypothetical protein